MPPKTTNGLGTGTVILSADETTAKVSLSFSGLGTPANAAHIHGPAVPGVNAPVLFPLTVPAATSGSVNDVTISLTPQQVQFLKDGLLYFNVQTTTNPGGEIRGQILSNPIEEPAFFVRQHYLDFLNRQPDAGGDGPRADHAPEGSAPHPTVVIITATGPYYETFDTSTTGWLMGETTNSIGAVQVAPCQILHDMLAGRRAGPPSEMTYCVPVNEACREPSP